MPRSKKPKQVSVIHAVPVDEDSEIWSEVCETKPRPADMVAAVAEKLLLGWDKGRVMRFFGITAKEADVYYGRALIYNTVGGGFNVSPELVRALAPALRVEIAMKNKEIDPAVSLKAIDGLERYPSVGLRDADQAVHSIDMGVLSKIADVRPEVPGEVIDLPFQIEKGNSDGKTEANADADAQAGSEERLLNNEADDRT